MRLNRSVILQERAVAADAVETFDLPVNPITALLLCIRPLNETSTLLNYAPYATLASSLLRITVLYRGASVFSMSGADACCLNYLRHGIIPREPNPDDTDNERRCVVLPILFGRFCWDPSSCFPASRRGELVCELDIDVANTGYDGFRYSVEAIEILDAKPTEYERKITTSRTFAATGPNDIELPLGNKLRGMMLFGTTSFTGATPVPSWGRISLFLDNQQTVVSAADWEALYVDNALLGRLPPFPDRHTHRVDATGVATQETTLANEWGMGVWDQRVWLDLDPTRDDMFSVDSSGAASFFLHSEAETADAVRVITVEQIPISA